MTDVYEFPPGAECERCHALIEAACFGCEARPPHVFCQDHFEAHYEAVHGIRGIRSGKLLPPEHNTEDRTP